MTMMIATMMMMMMLMLTMMITIRRLRFFLKVRVQLTI
jgi:hypothetical protein